MRVLTVHELEAVSGGSFLTAPFTVHATLSAASYVSYSYLSGNTPTWQGAAASAVVGGAAKFGINPMTGTITPGSATVASGTAAATGAVEGTLNGKGPIGQSIRNYINGATTSYNQRLEDALAGI